MIYMHIIKALYYQSYIFPHAKVWIIGIIMFILSMAIAFLGYVLPWGQMSFWGATVITNLFTAIPFIGEKMAYWLWGGYSVNNATLNRFFSLHYVLPFILLGLILLHLILLHIPGSSNPLKIADHDQKIPFYPYYFLKDLFAFLVSLIFFSFIVFYHPNLLGHSDNYIPANPLVTPTHIVPEWYFLPFYAILRSIPNKLQGVFLMGFSLVILFFLPLYYSFYLRFFLKWNTDANLRKYFRKDMYFIPFTANPKLRPTYRFFVWLFIINVFILGYIGGRPVETPFIQIGEFATFFYFFSFVLFGLSLFIDHVRYTNKSK